MNFEKLSEQYSPMIHSIYHSIHVYKDQEEFYQIGLIALWEASRRYDEGKGKFSTYAYKWVKGKMLTYLSKKRKEESFNQSLPLEEWNDRIGHHKDPYFEKENLLSHFHHLTDREKQWVILYFFEGWNNSEIARKENLKITGVRSFQKRAMRKFTSKYP